MLAFFIEVPTRTVEGFVKSRPFTARQAATIQIDHTMPRVVDPELEEPTEWEIGIHIPVELLEEYAGALTPLHGQQWRGNCYKCADGSSHPHWASWSPVNELNFHRPQDFGSFRFA